MIDLAREAVDLAVELVHDAIGGLLLPLDVRKLVGERVSLGAQALELFLDRRALAADTLEALLVVAQLLVERWGTLGGKRPGGERQQQTGARQGRGPSYLP
jgi:hypothetical protein